MTAAAPLLEARGLGIGFPGVRAVSAVDFDVRPGEVHALVGENGAGKSTLGRLLSGVGIDGLPGLDGGRQAVADGKLAATFVYPTGGREAVEIAARILRGDSVPHRNTLPTERIVR